MKTLDALRKQEERIIARHSYLLDVEFRPVSQSGLTVAELTRFMDDAWKHTYQGWERFIYDEPYLQWAFGLKGFDSDMSPLAYKGERRKAATTFLPWRGGAHQGTF